ncbi:MAG: hypothetical protein JNJ83_18690 [Verrucomicrobiaceae bacterium]|nr:hypothetical protein [Verrucomicrobiaceae bacterium]
MTRLIFAALFSLALTCCSSPQAGNKQHYFISNVKPVLQQHCLRCHNGTGPGLNLSTQATAFVPTVDGRRYLVPGDPDASLLIQAIQRNGTHPKMMPRDLLSLTEDQIGMLREWIEDGAVWPSDKSGQLSHQPSGEHPAH